MSRWIEQFEAHAFQNTWSNLKASLDESTVDDETVMTAVKELARLKKVIAYLDEMINGIDPELVPMATWDSFNSQATPCLQQINNYNSNRNMGHITQANAHADNLMTYIRPYMVVEGKVSKALQESIKKYSKLIDEYGDSFREKSSKLVGEITDYKIQAEELFVLIENVKKLVDEFDSELFGEEEAPGLQDKIRSLVKEAEEKYEHINEFYNEILIGDKDELSTKKAILHAKESVLDDQEKIETLLETVSKDVSDLGKFHVKVFGESNDDSETEGGLSGDLDKLINAVKDFEVEQSKKYNALNDQIEELLPGATSAGLATAYRVLRRSFSKPVRLYANLFYVSVAMLFLVSLVFVIDNVGFWHVKFIDASEPINLFNNFLFKLPFLLPVLWLAIFASKRRSEAQRLQQEYAHKEALAKSYQSFKKQIDELGEKDSQLLKQLLESAIKAISYNASITLDGKHGDKVPVQSAIENVVDAVLKRTSLK